MRIVVAESRSAIRARSAVAARNCGVETVIHLAVDVVGAQGNAGELGQGIGVLVGSPGSAKNRDLFASVF